MDTQKPKLSYIKFANGNFYTGEAIGLSPNGIGTITSESGIVVFQGKFARGKLDGIGCFVDKAGNRYIGNFSRGAINGISAIYYSDGTLYEGGFKKGGLVGYGILTKKDNIYKGLFENDFHYGAICKGDEENIFFNIEKFDDAFPSTDEGIKFLEESQKLAFQAQKEARDLINAFESIKERINEISKNVREDDLLIEESTDTDLKDFQDDINLFEESTSLSQSDYDERDERIDSLFAAEGQECIDFLNSKNQEQNQASTTPNATISVEECSAVEIDTNLSR